VTHLGAGVDELELDLLQSLPLGVNQKGLSQSENTLLRSNAASLDHDEVLLDQTVMGESTHGVDGLVSQIVVGGGIVLNKLSFLHVESITDVVDLLVDLGTMMVSLLTGTGNGKLDTARMPGSNTSNLTKTLVRLARKFLGVPTRSDTFESFALGDTNDIDHLVFSKDILDGEFLFEMLTGKVDFVAGGSTIDLDFHNVSLLLASPQDLLLSVANHAHNLAILLDLRKILFDLFLANFVLPFQAGLGKSLLLRLRPSFSG